MISANKVLSEKQLKKFLSKLKEEKDKALILLDAQPHKALPTENRVIMDFYIFTTLAYTGLRVSEVLKLTINDIGEDYISIPQEISKNNKSGSVFFGNKTRTLLNEYLNYRQGWNAKILFPSKNSRRGIISRSYLHTRFKYWLDKCGLPLHFSIHSLRHTYGTLSLDKGLSLTFVRDQLRHSSISVTSKYLHLTKENREKVKSIF